MSIRFRSNLHKICCSFTAPKLYGVTAAVKACHLSLSALDCGYMDLYMIHFPGSLGDMGGKRLSDPHGHVKDVRRQSWQALESLVINGSSTVQELSNNAVENETTIIGSGTYRVLRSIGVCNFLPRHVEEMSKYCTIPPAVIQVTFVFGSRMQIEIKPTINHSSHS